MHSKWYLKPVAYLDAPTVLNAAVTTIPGSGSNPLQVVASLALACHGLHVIDGMSAYIGVYVGSVGHEVRRAIIGGGRPHLVEVDIPRLSRVCFRNEEAASITSGTLCVVFMGAQS